MKITFADKVSTIISSLPIINRIRAEDVNEIKTVVNANADDLEEVQELFQCTSNTEQVIGKWDNKILYRKIITGTLSDTSGTQVVLDTLSDLDVVLNLRGTIGYLNNRNSKWCYPFPIISSDTFSQLWINGSNELKASWTNTPGTAWANTSICVIIEYTKTS